MQVTIAVAGCSPAEVGAELEDFHPALGVTGATLWECWGYGKGWPLEYGTMIRCSTETFGTALIVARKLARAFDQEAAYLEDSASGAWIVGTDYSLKTV